MRKFTKEISALLAATAMSASVCIASSAETTENIYRTDGVATMSDEEIQPSTIIERTAGVATISDEELFPPEDGVAMPEDYYIQPTTLAPTEVPPPIGTYVYEEPTEEDLPPEEGECSMPDDCTEPTIAPTTVPAPIGTYMYEEPTEEIPPLVGEPMPPDETIAEPTLRGDADMNGMVDLADLVAVSKHVLNRTAFPLKNSANADMNGDGVIDGVDISALIEEQLGS